MPVASNTARARYFDPTLAYPEQKDPNRGYVEPMDQLEETKPPGKKRVSFANSANPGEGEEDDDEYIAIQDSARSQRASAHLDPVRSNADLYFEDLATPVRLSSCVPLLMQY